jgi:hypothetical protein
MLQRPECDGCGRGDVERVHTPAHRDGHHGVGRRQRLGGQTGPLGPERERDPFRATRGVGIERLGVVAEGEREEPDPLCAEDRRQLVPAVEPRPRHLEHGAGADLDAAAVQRIRTARRDEYRVGAESRRRAERGSDVLVLHEILQDEDRARTADDLPQRRERGAVHGRQRSAMDRESRGRLDHRIGADVHLDLGIAEQRAQPVQPALLREHRARAVPRGHGTLDDFERFGDVQSAVDVAAQTQSGVGQPPVVVEPGICGVVDADLMHGSTLAGRPAVRRPARRPRRVPPVDSAWEVG